MLLLGALHRANSLPGPPMRHLPYLTCLLATILSLNFAHAVEPPLPTTTLCNSDEGPVLSCVLPDKSTMSLCVAMGPTPDTHAAQLRIGQIGWAPALLYPRARLPAGSAFRGSYEHHRAGSPTASGYVVKSTLDGTDLGLLWNAADERVENGRKVVIPERATLRNGPALTPCVEGTTTSNWPVFEKAKRYGLPGPNIVLQ